MPTVYQFGTESQATRIFGLLSYKLHPTSYKLILDLSLPYHHQDSQVVMEAP